MKKTTYFFALLLAGITLLSSCENEQLEGEFFSTPDGSDPQEFCDDAPLAISNAQIALINAAPEQQAELCNALIETINTTIDVCGDETGLFQALLDELGTDCMIDAGGGDDDDDDGGGDDMNDSLVGRTYLLTSITIESEFDFNGDGVATNELLSETECQTENTLFFNDEIIVTQVGTSVLDIFVEEDDMGNLEQIIQCTLVDLMVPGTYLRDGESLTVDFMGDIGNGIVDGNQLIFTELDFFLGAFINETGDGVDELEEDTVFTYTLQ